VLLLHGVRDWRFGGCLLLLLLLMMMILMVWFGCWVCIAAASMPDAERAPLPQRVAKKVQSVDTPDEMSYELHSLVCHKLMDGVYALNTAQPNRPLTGWKQYTVQEGGRRESVIPCQGTHEITLNTSMGL
jgi:hypothetical protein